MFTFCDKFSEIQKVKCSLQGWASLNRRPCFNFLNVQSMEIITGEQIQIVEEYFPSIRVNEVKNHLNYE